MNHIHQVEKEKSQNDTSQIFQSMTNQLQDRELT